MADEMVPVEKFCKICKRGSERFLHVEEAVVAGQTLLSMIKRLKHNQVPKLPSDFLFCMDCALSLYQADIFVYRLEQSLRTVITGRTEHLAAQVAQKTDKEGDNLEDISQNVSKGESDKMKASKGSWLFECRMCNYKTYSRNTFRYHMRRKHKDNDEYFYKCPYCPEAYQRSNAIQNHISHVHLNQPKPTRSRRKAIVKDTLNGTDIQPNDTTISDETEGDYMFKCDKCMYQIASAKCFKNHLANKHKDTDMRIYKCRSCGNAYQRFHMLQYHIASVHGNKPVTSSQRRNSVPEDFKKSTATTAEEDAVPVVYNISNCDICSHEASDDVSLKKHLVLMHQIDNKDGEEEQVNSIDSSCIMPHQLVTTKYNHEENDNTAVPLEENCVVSIPIPMVKDDTSESDSSFDGVRTRQNVSKRESDKMNATIGSWLFECRMCNYETYSRNMFRYHMRRMHKDNDDYFYKCPYCPESYQHSNAIQNHISHLHFNQPKPTRSRRKTIVRDTLNGTDIQANDTPISDETEGDYMFKCDKCIYQIASAKCFKKHLANKHKDTDMSIYKCLSCENAYQRFNLLQDHIASVHGNKPVASSQRRKSVPEDFKKSTATTAEEDAVPVVYNISNCDICSHEASDDVSLKNHLVLMHQTDNKDGEEELVNSIDSLCIHTKFNEEENDSTAVALEENCVVSTPIPMLKDDTSESDSSFDGVLTRPTKKTKRKRPTHTPNNSLEEQSYINDSLCEMPKQLKGEIHDPVENDNTVVALEEKDVVATAQSELTRICHLCSYEASSRLNLKRHFVLIHQMDDVFLDENDYKHREADAAQSLFEKSELPKQLMNDSKKKLDLEEKDVIATAQSKLTHICHLCSYESSSRLNLKEHFMLKHQMDDINLDENNYKDREDDANESLFKKPELPKQLMSDSKKILVVPSLRCEYCSYETNKKKLFRCHLFTDHQIEKAQIYKCTDCDESFARHKLLRIHFVHAHQKELPMPKDDTSESDSSFDRVLTRPTKKIKRKRPTQTPNDSLKERSNFNDSLCEIPKQLKRKKTDDPVENDNTVVALEEKDVIATAQSKLTHICHLCSYESSSRLNLKEHFMLKHQMDDINLDENNYKDREDDANESLFKKPELPKQLMSDSKKILVIPSLRCEYCSYETNKKKLFRCHLFTEHQIEKAQIYKCTDCDESFARHKLLRIHFVHAHQKELPMPKDDTSESDSSFDRVLTRPTKKIKRKRPTQTPNDSLEERSNFNDSLCEIPKQLKRKKIDDPVENDNTVVALEEKDVIATAQSKLTHICHLCSYESSSRLNLKEHFMLKHQMDDIILDENNYKDREDDANESLFKKPELPKQSMSDSKKILVVPSLRCEYCPYETNKKKLFRCHLFTEHQIEKTQMFKCTDCDESFARHKLLRIHFVHAHQKELPMPKEDTSESDSRFDRVLTRPTKKIKRKRPTQTANDSLEERSNFNDSLCEIPKQLKGKIHDPVENDNTVIALEENCVVSIPIPMLKDDTSDSSYDKVLTRPAKKLKQKRPTQTLNDSLSVLNSGLDSSPEHFVEKKKLKHARNLSASFKDSPNFDLYSPRASTFKEKYLKGEQTEKETSTPTTPKKIRDEWCAFKKGRFKLALPKKKKTLKAEKYHYSRE